MSDTKTLSPKELLPIYRMAILRGKYFDCMSESATSEKDACAFNQASEKQAEIEGNTHTKIVKRTANDLHDIYAKLVILKGGLEWMMVRGDFTQHEYLQIMDQVLAWVEAFAACETEPSGTDDSPAIKSIKAA